MSRPRTTLRTVIDASLCRRRQQRRKVCASQVRCWAPGQAPMWAAVIEADVQGARLIFPFPVQPHEQVRVSVPDELGFFQTRVARVAWTHFLEASGKVVAGVAFDQELVPAA